MLRDCHRHKIGETSSPLSGTCQNHQQQKPIYMFYKGNYLAHDLRISYQSDKERDAQEA